MPTLICKLADYGDYVVEVYGDTDQYEVYQRVLGESIAAPESFTDLRSALHCAMQHLLDEFDL